MVYRPQTVTHHNTNQAAHGRESNSRPVDHKSDALALSHHYQARTRLYVTLCFDRQCNRRSDVVSVVNDLYLGAFHQFYTTWQTQQKTIADSGFVLAGAWSRDDPCYRPSMM